MAIVMKQTENEVIIENSLKLQGNRLEFGDSKNKDDSILVMNIHDGNIGAIEFKEDEDNKIVMEYNAADNQFKINSVFKSSVNTPITIDRESGDVNIDTKLYLRGCNVLTDKSHLDGRAIIDNTISELKLNGLKTGNAGEYLKSDGKGGFYWDKS